MSDIDWEALEQQMEERRRYANAMIDRINNGDMASVGLDQKDWIILRLLFLLYKEGRNASEPEARKIIGWFNDQHPGYGQEVMLAAFSRLAGEKRTRSENIYEPYWKEKGKWE